MLPLMMTAREILKILYKRWMVEDISKRQSSSINSSNKKRKSYYTHPFRRHAKRNCKFNLEASWIKNSYINIP